LGGIERSIGGKFVGARSEQGVAAQVGFVIAASFVTKTGVE